MNSRIICVIEGAQTFLEGSESSRIGRVAHQRTDGCGDGRRNLVKSANFGHKWGEQRLFQHQCLPIGRTLQFKIKQKNFIQSHNMRI